MNLNSKLIAATFKIEGPGINPGATSADSVQVVDKILSFIIGFLSILLIIWLVIRIILASYSYISSSGDKNKVEQARRALTEGVIGLTIGLLAIFIVSLLAKLIGVDDALNLPAQIQKIITF